MYRIQYFWNEEFLYGYKEEHPTLPHQGDRVYIYANNTGYTGTVDYILWEYMKDSDEKRILIFLVP